MGHKKLSWYGEQKEVSFIDPIMKIVHNVTKNSFNNVFPVNTIRSAM